MVMISKVDQILEWQRRASGVSWDETEFAKLSLTESIAAADRVAGFCRASNERRPADHVRQEAVQWENLAKIMKWFLGRGNVATVGDMLTEIREKKVSLDVVSFWADEMFASEQLPPCVLHSCIVKAYPEVGERMEFRQQQQIAQSLRRSKEIIDTM